MNFNINKLRPHIVSHHYPVQEILPDLHSQLITTLSCIRFLGIIICSNPACLIILITHVRMTKRSVALFTMKLDLKLSKTYTSLLYTSTLVHELLQFSMGPLWYEAMAIEKVQIQGFPYKVMTKVSHHPLNYLLSSSPLS